MESERGTSDLEKAVSKSSVAVEVTAEPLEAFEKAPDGGLQAWLVVAGAFCIVFTGLGFTNSFGVFLEYYRTHQLEEQRADDIAWIGSIAAFAQFGSGAIGGPMFDRYGAWIMRPAAILYIFSIMMTSLCYEYWQFMLAQGVLMGVIMGFLQFPAMAAVSQYFDKKRAAALGLVISGSSIGGIIIPIALAKMLNGTSLGFGWSIRIVGFVSLPLMVFACVTVKPRLPSRTTNFFLKAAFFDKTFVLLIISLFFNLLGMFTPLFFLPTYATSHGMDPQLASYLIAIVNAASFFGRVIPGALADKLGRINMFAFAGLATGVVICCWTLAKTTAGIVGYSVVIGFISGTIVSAGSAAMSSCPKDARNIGTYMGMGMAIGSIAALIGPPINGAILVRYGGFLQVSIFSGVMCMVGGCFAVLSKFVSKGTK